MAIWLTSEGAAKNGAIRKMREGWNEERGRQIFHRAPCRSGRVRVRERPRPPGRPATGRSPVRTAASSVAADSMSTAIAPVASRADRSGPPDHVVGAGERAGVDRAPGQQAHEFLDQQFGAHARDGPARVPGLLGDDQVAGVHPGGEPGAEAGGQHGRVGRRRAGEVPGDGAFRRLGAHPRTDDGVRPAGTPPDRRAPAPRPPVAGAQGEVLDAERAGDQQRGRGGLVAQVSSRRPGTRPSRSWPAGCARRGPRAGSGRAR